MFRTESSSVRVLQAVAVIAGLAVLFWSLGLQLLTPANAAGLTSISDTLSDSAPNVASNHTIAFTLPSIGTPLGSADTITITFPTATFNLSSIGILDFDFATGSDYTLDQGAPAADNIGVATTSDTITFTMGSAVAIATGTTISIEVGDQAAFGGAGSGQIVNPASSSYEIDIATNEGDTGSTRVVILDNVTVSASVDTNFNFAVSSVGSGQTVNGTTTTGTSSANAIAFGTLLDAVSSTTAQDLTVSTNATEGFVVTAHVDGDLRSSSGAEIDGFVDNSNTNTPTAWTQPSEIVSDNNTWGHWGITSDDATTTRATEFASDEWIGATTTPRVVMSHNGSADGVTPGAGLARIGFRVEISSLQEAGDDYSAILTYVATPTF